MITECVASDAGGSEMAGRELPERVPLEKLNEAIEQAIGLANEREALSVRSAPVGLDFFRSPWFLIGRQLVEEASLDDAHAFSVAVTSGVQESLGLRLSPTVMVIDQDILCGFIEKYDETIQPPLSRLGGPRIAGPGL
jgi:hypothetical protein